MSIKKYLLEGFWLTYRSSGCDLRIMFAPHGFGGWRFHVVGIEFSTTYHCFKPVMGSGRYKHIMRNARMLAPLREWTIFNPDTGESLFVSQLFEGDKQ